MVLMLLLVQGVFSRDAVIAAADRYQIDSQQSQVLIEVYRAGIFSALGHNHLLAVHQLAGIITVQPSGGVSAELGFRVNNLLVDDPGLRKKAGSAFQGEPDANDIIATRKNMLGARVLDAEQYPEINLQVVSVLCSATGCDSVVDITAKAVKKRYSVPLQVSDKDGILRVNGRFEVNQSDFDIKPFSVLGGVIKVADRLKIQFDLVAMPI